MSSSATTAAVTASSVTLAPENESAMSAPNAGPPVICSRRSPGAPSLAALRSALTVSARSKPGQVRGDRHGRQRRLAVLRGGRRWPGRRTRAASTRWRAASTAVRSAGDKRGAVGARGHQDHRRLVAAREVLGERRRLGPTRPTPEWEPARTWHPAFAPPAAMSAPAAASEQHGDQPRPPCGHDGGESVPDGMGPSILR